MVRKSAKLNIGNDETGKLSYDAMLKAVARGKKKLDVNVVKASYNTNTKPPTLKPEH